MRLEQSRKSPAIDPCINNVPMPRGNNGDITYAVLNNPAFERTAASALRLLAVPSSLRSSAAAQRERWTLAPVNKGRILWLVSIAPL